MRLSFLTRAGGMRKEGSGNARFWPEKAAQQCGVEEKEGQGTVSPSPSRELLVTAGSGL